MITTVSGTALVTCQLCWWRREWNSWKGAFSAHLAQAQISLLQRTCSGHESPTLPSCTRSTWHSKQAVWEATTPKHAPLLRDPGPQLGGQLSPSSSEMPSTDLWGIRHSCRDLVRSENRLLGTSIVSMLQCW